MPESLLELKLQGVFYITLNKKITRAIIEGPDHVQKNYKIDDELPDGAVLQSIEDEKIILLRNNRQEILELEGKKAAQQPASQ